MTELQLKQQEVRHLREELEKQEKALQLMYDKTIQSICPFKIDQEIEYEPDKKGFIQSIFFQRNFYEPLEDQEPQYWAVTGLKLNKDGSVGKKTYQPVSNKTHIIKGLVCRRKTLEETFGIK